MSRRRSPAGSSILEVMIAMAILAVGLLAMWNMHMIGLSSNAAGRRHTVAMAIARELVSGLERLPFGDPHLAHTGGTGPAAPAPFGRLVDGAGTIAAGAHVWDDASPVDGVRPTTAMRETAETAGYQRRWTVWGYSPAAGSPAAVKIIAVSVTWSDAPFPRPREVILYTQVHSPGAIFQNLAANQ